MKRFSDLSEKIKIAVLNVFGEKHFNQIFPNREKTTVFLIASKLVDKKIKLQKNIPNQEKIEEIQNVLSLLQTK